MRRLPVLLFGVLLAVGCARQLPFASESYTEEDAARAEVDKWMGAFRQAQSDTSASGAKLRGVLATEALSWGYYESSELARRTDVAALKKQGRADLDRAVRELPNDPQAFAALGTWLTRVEPDPKAAADASCRAADLAPNDADAAERCGDALVAADRAQDALERYKKGALAAQTADQQLELMARLEDAGGEQQLVDLPQAARERYRAQQQERLRSARDEKREEFLQSIRSRHLAYSYAAEQRLWAYDECVAKCDAEEARCAAGDEQACAAARDICETACDGHLGR